MNKDKKIENRRSKRYEVKGIKGNILYVHDIDVLNISIDGMAIETKKRLDLNRTYTFKFYRKDSVINLRGKVVWAMLVSKEDDNGLIVPVYRAGIKFLDTYTQETLAISEFIEENKIKTVEKRLGGVRFKIKKTDNVKLEYPESYVVKKLSQNGMLVETDTLYEENSYYVLELDIEKKNLIVKSRIAYSAKMSDEKVPKYEVGFEFIEMDDKDKKILDDFIKSLESQNS